jgi:hypothetical protein
MIDKTLKPVAVFLKLLLSAVVSWILVLVLIFGLMQLKLIHFCHAFGRTDKLLQCTNPLVSLEAMVIYLVIAYIVISIYMFKFLGRLIK